MATPEQRNNPRNEILKVTTFVGGSLGLTAGAVAWYLTTGDDSVAIEAVNSSADSGAGSESVDEVNETEVAETSEETAEPRTTQELLREQFPNHYEDSVASDNSNGITATYTAGHIDTNLFEVSEITTSTQAELLPLTGEVSSEVVTCFDIDEDIVAEVTPGCGGAIQMFRDLGENLVDYLEGLEGEMTNSQMIAFFPEGSPMRDLVEAQLSGDRETIYNTAEGLARDHGFYNPNNPDGDSLTIFRGATFTVSDGNLLFNQPGGEPQELWNCADGKTSATGGWMDTQPCVDGERPDVELNETPSPRPEVIEQTLAITADPALRPTPEVLQGASETPLIPVEVSSDLVNVHVQQFNNLCDVDSRFCVDGEYAGTYVFSALDINDGATESEVARLMQQLDTRVGFIHEVDANGDPTGQLRCVELLPGDRIEHSTFLLNNEQARLHAEYNRFREPTYPSSYLVTDGEIDSYLDGTIDNHGKVQYPDEPTRVLFSETGEDVRVAGTPFEQERVIQKDVFSSSNLSEAATQSRWEAIRDLELPSSTEVDRAFFVSQGLSTSEARDLAHWIRGLSGESSLFNFNEVTTPLREGETLGAYLDRALPHYTDTLNVSYVSSVNAR